VNSRWMAGGDLANMASNGMTARQLLGREEQQRSMQRGESMISNRSSSLRSSLKGVSCFCFSEAVFSSHGEAGYRGGGGKGHFRLDSSHRCA